MADDTKISVIIIYSFIFLFFVFIFLQNGDIVRTTGYATSEDSGSFSSIIIVAVVIVVLGAAGFFIYKRIKKKKETPLEIPKPPIPTEKSIETLNKDFNIPSTSNIPAMDNDINKLFSENVPTPNIPESQINIQNQNIPMPSIPEADEINEKPKIDERLKKIIKVMIERKYNKESMMKYLKNKNYTLVQIKKAIDSINKDNISDYVELSLSQGFSKQQIINSLIKSGWKKEDILEYT